MFEKMSFLKKNLCIGYESVNNFLNNTDMFKKLCNSLDG